MSLLSTTFNADDQNIDRLLQEFVDRRAAGEAIEIAAFAAENPSYRERLEELLPAFLAMEQCAASVDTNGRSDFAPRTLGDYEILRLIGRGGMGLVFEAYHQPLDRRVALKLLAPWRAGAPQARERFLNEAQSIAGLQHDNLIPIFDVGSAGGLDYFAMQLIDGINGRDLIFAMRGSEDGPSGCGTNTTHASPDSMVHLGEIPSSHHEVSPAPFVLPTLRTTVHWQFAAHACMQSARALHHAHNAGVVHRDVKPSNMLFDHDGKVWISDFGLAKKPDSELTRTGVAMGTLRYMAPEQFRGEETDGRADIYGLGVTLFELLTLHDSAVPSTTQLVKKDGPPLLEATLLEPVPVPLRNVVLRAVMRSPDRRYQNALEVAQDLENYLNDQPIRASGPTPLERVRWHLSKHRSAWLSAAICLILFAAIVGAVYLRNVPEKAFVMVNGNELYINGRDCEVATWVIQEGGGVTIFDGYQQLLVYDVEDLPNRLYNVTSVKFWDYNGLDAEKFAGIVNLKRLNELLFDNCRFSTDCIRLLPGTPLISLQLNECDLSDESLMHIAKLNKLSWLGLRDNRLTDEGVEKLRPLLNLSEVNLSGNSLLTNRCLRPFAGKKAMFLVDVRGTRVDASSAQAYQSVIQRYDLSSKVLHGELLTTVTIHGDKLYPEGGDREVAEWVLRRGGTVIVLERKGRTDIYAEEKLPAGLFNITSVSLSSYDGLTEEDVRRFVALPRLDDLVLKGCNFDERWIPLLAAAPLVSLELQDCGLSNNAAQELSKLKYVNWLKLAHNNLTDEGVSLLAQLSMLAELDLRGNRQVSDRALELLGDARYTLQRIDARGTQVTKVAAAQLQERLTAVDSEAKVLAGSEPSD